MWEAVEPASGPHVSGRNCIESIIMSESDKQETNGRQSGTAPETDGEVTTREASAAEPIRASHHQDRDILLEYKSMAMEPRARVFIRGVPVDNLTRDEALAVTLQKMERGRKFRMVLFLDPVRLMFLSKHARGEDIIRSSSLVLPEGGGLAWGSRRLRTPLQEKVATISYMMDLIRLAEKKDLTIFLLGGTDEVVERVFLNLSKSFPSVRIVGRHAGYFQKGREEKVKQAIRKTNPDILIVGLGFPKEQFWVIDNREYFPETLVVTVAGSLDILSGRVKKAPDGVQLRGLTWLWRLMGHPWRLRRIFWVLQYYVTLAFSRDPAGLNKTAKKARKRKNKDKTEKAAKKQS